MADEPSLEELEKMEKHYQRYIDLLNQADRALQEFRVARGDFVKAHHANAPKGTSIEDAITKIEKVLTEATNIHNEVIGHINEAKAEASQRTVDPGY